MAWLIGAFLFWLALKGELGKYAGFATTSNPAGTLGAVLGGLPSWLGGSLKSAAGQGSPAPSKSGQPMPGANSSDANAPTVMSPAGQAPGTYTNALGYPTALNTDAGLPVYSASSPALGYLTQAQGYVAGGAAGL